MAGRGGLLLKWVCNLVICLLRKCSVVGYFREVLAVSVILLGGLEVEESTGLRVLPFISKVKTTSVPKALTFASFF